jgi:hypothetical protein
VNIKKKITAEVFIFQLTCILFSYKQIFVYFSIIIYGQIILFCVEFLFIMVNSFNYYFILLRNTDWMGNSILPH